VVGAEADRAERLALVSAGNARRQRGEAFGGGSGGWGGGGFGGGGDGGGFGDLAAAAAERRRFRKLVARDEKERM